MRPLKLIPDNTNIDFLKLRWIALGLSIFLLVGSLALTFTRGLNWGADFTGGQAMRVTFAKQVSTDQIRGRMQALGLSEVSIQESGDGREMTIRIPLAGEKSNPVAQCFGASPLATTKDKGGAANATASKVRADLLKAYPGTKIGSVESVSGKVSCELFSSGSLALSLALAGIALYIWFCFEWQFGVGALVTLAHDVILTFGFFSLTQLQFDLGIVAAVLTIAGYSLQDTIVVYDRVRENMRKWRRMDVPGLLNVSLNETLSRTVTTSLSLVLTLGILLALGPDVIFGFVAVMLLGILVGTFSSLYISVPCLLWLNVTPDSFVPTEEGGKSPERIVPSEGFLDR